MAAVDVNSVLQTAMRLLAPQLEMQSARLLLDLGSSLAPVYADSNQLLHVYLHLAGQIGTRLHPEENRQIHVRTRQEGDVVAVDFSVDTPSSETLYQPLHDSESGTRPSTLSLGACWRIVKEHGGRVLAQPSPGGYVAFRVELPIATKSGSQPAFRHEPTRAVAGTST
jgi:C4-dicarboxylate-specific signal transduction histidine kinase